MTWIKLKQQLINLLKREAIKVALRRLLITSSIGTWIITYIVGELFDDFAAPKLRAVFRKAGLGIDKIEGKLVINKLERADNENDLGGVTDAIDDVYRV